MCIGVSTAETFILIFVGDFAGQHFLAYQKIDFFELSKQMAAGLSAWLCLSRIQTSRLAFAHVHSPLPCLCSLCKCNLI